MPVVPVLLPGRAAAQDQIQDDQDDGQGQAEEDADVKSGVVGVDQVLVVIGVVVVVGALDGALVKFVFVGDPVTGGLVVAHDDHYMSNEYLANSSVLLMITSPLSSLFRKRFDFSVPISSWAGLPG